jgi:5-methyltetrahydropteroyltriglutamate--homocysteine methyltransferase
MHFANFLRHVTMELETVARTMIGRTINSVRIVTETRRNKRKIELRRSDSRILTTHVGSLPRPRELLAPLAAKDAGEPVDSAALENLVRRSVADVVCRQIDVGIDVVNDGEHSKSSFAYYARNRIGGLRRSPDDPRRHAETRDSLAFPEVYAEMKRMYAARSNDASGARIAMPPLSCVEPLTYVGWTDLRTDIDNLKRAMPGKEEEDAFITAISPTNLEMYFKNEFYGSDEDYLEALANVMHEEFKAITDAGFVLQVDDPRLATHYNRTPNATNEECRAFIAKRVEMINYALRDIPEDRVRYHTCYSINVAPRMHDLELKHFVDLMLRIKAGAYSIEAANPRHEHEWQVWENVKLPAGKLLIPGVVSHCIMLVEHPELVAQRLVRFASVVGRENILASNDCGFATSAAGDEPHPDIAWAKLEALAEGARIASRRLW